MFFSCTWKLTWWKVSCLEDVRFFWGASSKRTQADGSIFSWKNVGDTEFSEVDIPATGNSAGTGFQSMASLQEIPANVDTLKICYGGLWRIAHLEVLPNHHHHQHDHGRWRHWWSAYPYLRRRAPWLEVSKGFRFVLWWNLLTTNPPGSKKKGVDGGNFPGKWENDHLQLVARRIDMKHSFLRVFTIYLSTSTYYCRDHGVSCPECCLGCDGRSLQRTKSQKLWP